MNSTIKAYVEEILSFVSADSNTLEKLSADLTAHITEASAERPINEVIARMGTPAEIAAEITEAIYSDKASVIRELIKVKTELKDAGVYEYKSKNKLFGIPLVHIKLTRKYTHSRRISVAKGIIAIGDCAVGLVSIGGFAVGGLVFGGIGAGVISIGGLALGLLLAFGGASIGFIAFGGAALGAFAYGGAALASHIAVGGAARANVAIGQYAEGLHTLIVSSSDVPTAEEAQELILRAYPNISEFFIRLSTLFFR